jgi:hypothetical protein
LEPAQAILVGDPVFAVFIRRAASQERGVFLAFILLAGIGSGVMQDQIRYLDRRCHGGGSTSAYYVDA